MSKEQRAFTGFRSPNYTMVPDEVFDELLGALTHNELRVLLYICRRTFGFKKNADAISFNQFLKGIVTQDGHRLDHGCGITNPTRLSEALKKLEAGGYILADKGKDERGENVTTIYRLHFRKEGTTTLVEGVLPEREYRTTGLTSRVLPGRQSQETEIQETEQQHVVVGKLTERGVTGLVAQTLASTHSREELQLQLEVFDWLKECQPKRLGKNAPGYLRKAIEEGYQPPQGYKSPEQRQAEEAQRKAELAALEQQLQSADEDLERTKESVRQVLQKNHAPRQIKDSELTTETAWQMTLSRLEAGMSAVNYHTWLEHTVLTSCDRSKALIVAPSTFVAEHLSTRFSHLIKKELESVLGFHPAQIEYLTLSELGLSAPNGQPAASNRLP